MKKLLFIIIFVATHCLAAVGNEVYSTVPRATLFNTVDELKTVEMKEEWRPVIGYEGFYEVSSSYISRNCLGKRNTGGGFLWKF